MTQNSSEESLFVNNRVMNELLDKQFKKWIKKGEKQCQKKK